MEEIVWARWRARSFLHTPLSFYLSPSLFSYILIILLSNSTNSNRHEWREEARRLLPTYHEDAIPSAIPATEVTKTALRLRHLIEECIPCELEEDVVTKAHSKIISQKVIRAAKEAGGKDYGACVVYCLLVNKRWFKKQASLELWDADLHNIRATACEVIAKQVIETEDDQDYLLQDVLLKRYSILVDGEETMPANVIERAVDLHALRVTGSSGYQKCVNYLWRGWLVQDENVSCPVYVLVLVVWMIRTMFLRR